MKQFFCLVLTVSSILLLTTCVYHDTAIRVDCELSGLSIKMDSVDAAASCSVANGAIYVTANGGEHPYTFKANDKVFDSDTLAGLFPGIYTVRVIDSNGCEAIITNIEVPAQGVMVTPMFEPDTECYSDNGVVTIDIDNGKPPYAFNIDGGAFSPDSTFRDLHFGIHTIKAQDIDGCELSLAVDVPRGRTEVRWISDIQPLFTTHCATSGCHNGISRTTDFRKYKTAKKYALEIKELTEKRKMPFDGSLSQAQIDLIACWVDDGALED